MQKNSAKVILETIACVSISDCKRGGLLNPGGSRPVIFSWKGMPGGESPRVRATADPSRSSVCLEYELNGEKHEQSLVIRTTPSNSGRGVCHIFVCPETGRSCRKLYFVGGRFVSRHAFGGRYLSQAGPHKKSPFYECWVFNLADLVESERRLNALVGQKRRKSEYRGELTPYGRRVQEAIAMANDRLWLSRLLSKEIRRALPDPPNMETNRENPILFRHWRIVLQRLSPGLYDEDSPLIDQVRADLEKELTARATVKMMTRDAVMNALGVSSTTLWRWEKIGYLVPVMVGGQRRYKSWDIEQIMMEDSPLIE